MGGSWGILGVVWGVGGAFWGGWMGGAFWGGGCIGRVISDGFGSICGGFGSVWGTAPFPPPSGPHFWGERGGIWAHFGVSPPPPVPQTPAPGSEAAPSGAAESR